MNTFRNGHSRAILSTLSILFVGVIAQAFISRVAGQGTPIPFSEKFALAENRQSVLNRLVPGSNDYFFYSALHLQQVGKLKEVDQLVSRWEAVARNKGGHRWDQIKEIKVRQLLLKYPDQPEASLKRLKDYLGVRFNHQPETIQGDKKYPSKLDSKWSSFQTWKKNYGNLSYHNNNGLFIFPTKNLSSSKRYQLLTRIQLPDFPNLVSIIDQDMKARRGVAFGSLPIHKRLTLDQLKQLLKKRPSLKNQREFVSTYLKKMVPNNDTAAWRDSKVKRAYLDECWNFVKTLPPSFISLKASILFQQLKLDQKEGIFNKQRFIAYLSTPRNAYYLNPKWSQEMRKKSGYSADLNYRCPVYLIDTIRNDEKLVRFYLEHYLLDKDNTSEFETWVEGRYLKRIFGELKLVTGQDDAKEWSELFSPEELKRLNERVDLEFAATTPGSWKPGESVELDVRTKGIKKLIVKVFDINAENFYRQFQREITTDINLDGLIPSFQKTYDYDTPSIRSVERKFQFPQCDKNGVYVIDFIGNGKSSRALVIKGELNFFATNTPSGHRVVVLDHAGEIVKSSKVWIDGRWVKSDKDGDILIPYTSKPGQKRVVVSDGKISSLGSLKHLGSSYQFDAGILVNRESVLPNRNGSIVVRPTLHINGKSVPLSSLVESKIVLSAYNKDNIPSTKTIKVKFEDQKELNVPLQLGEGIDRFQVQVAVGFNDPISGNMVNKSVQKTFYLNQIHKTLFFDQVHLVPTAKGYFLEVRGKTGEVRVDRPINIEMYHELFTSSRSIVLQTDQFGRIELGTLPGVKKLSVSSKGIPKQSFALRRSGESYQNVRHVLEGESIEIPYADLTTIQNGEKGKLTAPQMGRMDFGLFEIREGEIVKDCFDKLSHSGGRVVVDGLPAGDYQFHWKRENRVIDLKVSGGKKVKHLLVGKHRIIARDYAQTAAIAEVQSGKEFITVKLDNWTKDTRVHVFGNRFYPAFDLVGLLQAGREGNPSSLTTSYNGSSYVTGRAIGDEYDYILRRQLARQFPGLMLPKPSLILNPFKIRQTNNQNQNVSKGDDFKSRSSAFGGRAGQSKAAPGKNSNPQGLKDYSTLEFLGEMPVQMIGLRPDEDGFVKIPRKPFVGKQTVKFVLVDGDQIQSSEMRFAAQNLEPLDLRFDKTLDSSTHFSQNKTVVELSAGSVTKFQRSENPRVRVFNELKDVYQFYMSQFANGNLRKFAFITNWPKYKREKKTELYSKFACHELNFFLSKKDPEFFKSVVRPYLKNKYEKTFMDLYLLDLDVTGYLQSQQFGTLNYVEQILLVNRLENQRKSLSKAIIDRLDVLTANRPQPERQFNIALGSSFDNTLFFELEKQKLGISERLSRDVDGVVLSDQLKAMEKKLDGKKGVYFTKPGGGGALGGGGGFGGGGADFGAADDKEAASPAGMSGYAQNGKLPRSKSEFRPGSELRSRLKKSKGGKDRGRRMAGESMRREDKKFSGRKRRVQRYQPISPTYEWAENNYYQLPPGTSTNSLVQANRFWLDYCRHSKKGAKDRFLSRNFLEVGGSFSELMFALSVLDLPLNSKTEKVTTEKDQISIQVDGDSLAVLRRLEKAKSNDPDTKILVSENFIRVDDPSVVINGIRYDKFVADKFFTHVVYQGQVAVTNPTSSPRSFQLLVQIPEGSIPVKNGAGTKTVSVQLAPYSTTTFTTFFYFPVKGEFRHYPAQVSKDRVHLANGKVRTFSVKKEVVKLDEKSWTYIARYGTDKQVFEFLNGNNLWKTPLGKVAYRLRDKKFYQSMIKLLDERHFNDSTTNSYSVLHNDQETLSKFIRSHTSFRRIVGPYFQSSWLTIDDQKDNRYHHREYWPLVNSRFHQLGTVRRITNPALFSQYSQLLGRLIRKHQLTADDQLAICYYLLAQDRYQQALDFFAKVKRKSISAKIQYDYLSASLSMIQSDTRKATKIARGYLEHPVERWRHRFQAIVDQVAQIDNPDAVVQSEQHFGKDNLFKEHTDQSNIANDAPSFDFDVRSDAIQLRYRNLKKAKVNFYEIDLELLFSRNPFQKTGSKSFDWVKPNLSKSQVVDPKKNETEIPIPESLKNRNLLVEVAAGGTSQTVPYYSRAFDAQFAEAFGQLRVTAKGSRNPIGRVYIKVYAKMKNGKVQFFKDGYTDLRGRFDYVSQNNVPLNNVERLSVLVLSKDKGAFTKEVSPPSR